MRMNYLRAFKRSVKRFSNKTAIHCLDGNEYTYAELDSRTNALAAGLDERLGEKRTASLLCNGLAAIEMMIAAQKRRQANAQLSFRGAATELEYMIETAEADALIFDEANAEMAQKLLEARDFEAAISVGDTLLENSLVEPYEELITTATSTYETNSSAESESAILYTSGTTSKPKAVLQDQGRAWKASHQAALEMSLDPQDTALIVTPWYHDVTTVAWIFPHLQVGATLVPHPEFDPEQTLANIEAHDATGLLAVPAQLTTMLDVQEEKQYNTNSLTYIRTGGAVVPGSLVERASEMLTENIHNTYGLTEGFANLTHAYPYEQQEQPGTVGSESFIWEVRVVEAEDPTTDPDPAATVDRGETGEILGRGPFTDGYLDSPKEEEKLFVGDWIRTGDIARIDENGGLHIIDRIDNMIVTGGENVYPQEVEGVLQKHPDVYEAGVVGLPDDEWGQRLASVIVTDADLTADGLEEYCRADDTLADFKRPRVYVFTSESLPRTDTGTLRRTEVRERYFD